MNAKAPETLPTETIPPEIAGRALESADRFLAAAETTVAGVAGQLRAGLVEPALGELTRVLDGVVSLASLSSDLRHVAPQAAIVPVEEFRDVLKSIVELEESRDWAALADGLERGLVPRLGRWRQVFAQAL